MTFKAWVSALHRFPASKPVTATQIDRVADEGPTDLVEVTEVRATPNGGFMQEQIWPQKFSFRCEAGTYQLEDIVTVTIAKTGERGGSW